VAINQTPSDPAYPAALQQSEEELIKKRPGREPLDRAELVGVGLSGGGIRSATFCLGVFQAFGKLGLLKKIDYTSSVSGGGYFTSFYGRLFTRENGKDANGKDVEGVNDLVDLAAILAPDETHPADGPASAWKRGVFGWLRENGRYLAPHGAGDLLFDLTVVVRNWLSLQVVLAMFILMLFLAAQLLRAGIQQFDIGEYYQNLYAYLPGSDHFWWSPYTVVALALFVLLAIPLGWAYWLVASGRSSQPEPYAWWAPILFVAAAGALLILWLTGMISRPANGYIVVTGVAGLIPLFTLAFALAALAGMAKASTDDYDKAAGWLSQILKDVLTVGLGILAFALVDSVGQQAYLNRFSWGWVGPVLGFGPAVVLAPFVKWIAANLTGRTKTKHVSLPLGLLAGLGAAVIILPVLVLLDGLSHAVAYEFRQPIAPAGAIYEPTSTLKCHIEGSDWKLTGECTQSSVGKPDRTSPRVASRMQWRPILAVFVALLVLSSFAGRMRGFLNISTLLYLYGSRLVRAYLGASNPERLQGRWQGVTEVVDGDDMKQEEYWSPQPAEKYAKGAPLHLVNVTINETYGGRSQVEQRDRKGRGMAIGPAGISAGVRHHVVFNRNPQPAAGAPPSDTPNIYKDVTIFPPAGTETVRAFEYPDNIYRGQLLHLGSWTGISGAAASTGLGHLTSLGLSLITGFFNVRLGYWWDSGVSFAHRKAPSRNEKLSKKIGRLFQFVFPVQRQLLNELLARFPGTSEQYWYLTDGGHFENMGGYELIRRRLALIVIIDAEGDPDYTFPGLAGLIQKARLDFGAEIKFLNGEQLDDRLGKYHTMRQYFGTLDQLRRGTWTEEPVDDPDTAKSRLSLKPPDRDSFSLAHAALAKIRYAKLDNEVEPPPAWMIVIKPTLTGDEPADLLHYHGEHPTFPHESTADQFFDEAQWESCRKLGEHIATQLFEWNDEKKPFPSFTA
jgi:hypothetical protein